MYKHIKVSWFLSSLSFLPPNVLKYFFSVIFYSATLPFDRIVLVWFIHFFTTYTILFVILIHWYLCPCISVCVGLCVWRGECVHKTICLHIITRAFTRGGGNEVPNTLKIIIEKNELIYWRIFRFINWNTSKEIYQLINHFFQNSNTPLCKISC